MIYGYASLGYTGILVSIELDMSNSIPGLEIVGLPSSEVKEARDRVKVAIRNSGFKWPGKRMVINLAPADIKKRGAGFDLPIALSILIATGQISECNDDILALGELQFNGLVRPVSHALSAASCGLENGINLFVAHNKNVREIFAFPESNCCSVDNLSLLGESMNFTTSHTSVNTTINHSNTQIEATTSYDSKKTLSDLSYCDELKRIIQIAAAGRHNLHLSGAPGTGKTSSALRLVSLLPKLSYEESIEVSRVYSCNDSLDTQYSLIEQRPVRMPHHTASVEAMIGSAAGRSPGEISLSHGGVLILDEAPEFKSNVLQALREPMDNHYVHISRAEQKWSCPADFQLILTSNLCPCGNTGKSDASGEWCLCSEKEIFRYWKRIGGAIWDRIDIKYRCPSSNMHTEEPLESRMSTMKKIEAQVHNAINIQAIRYKDYPHKWNARCDTTLMNILFNFSEKAQSHLFSLVKTMGISERGRGMVSKIARTIADLENSEQILLEHLEEAVRYIGIEGQVLA